jgi:hypothetical protein
LATEIKSGVFLEKNRIHPALAALHLPIPF